MRALFTLTIALGACGGGTSPMLQEPDLANITTVSTTSDAAPANAIDGGAVTGDGGGETPDLAHASTTGKIKWNPGHYMASDSSLKNGTTDLESNGVSTELADLAKFPAMKGYLIYVAWAHVEPTENNYDFSVLDEIFARLKQQKQRFAIHIETGPATGGSLLPGKDDGAYIPMYILSDPKTYGASLPAGDPNGYGGYYGAATGGYFANLTNANVMARFTALVDALGKHFDGDPSFEAFVAVNETANIYPVKTAGIPDAAFTTMVENMASASVGAFPTSSVMAQNTWSGSIQDTYDFAAWMLAHRVAPSSPDTFGATAFEKYTYDMPNGGLAWGLQAYLGLADTGITGVMDMRPQSRAMLEVQPGDMGIFQHLGANAGGPFAPTDIANACNLYYQASHVFWTHFAGTEQTPFPAGLKWSELAPAVLAIPLVHTDYPESYPQ